MCQVRDEPAADQLREPGGGAHQVIRDPGSTKCPRSPDPISKL